MHTVLAGVSRKYLHRHPLSWPTDRVQTNTDGKIKLGVQDIVLHSLHSGYSDGRIWNLHGILIGHKQTENDSKEGWIWTVFIHEYLIFITFARRMTMKVETLHSSAKQGKQQRWTVEACAEYPIKTLHVLRVVPWWYRKQLKCLLFHWYYGLFYFSL